MDDTDFPDSRELLRSEAFITGLMRVLTIVVVFVCIEIVLSSPWGDTLLRRINKVETPWFTINLAEPKQKLDEVTHNKAVDTSSSAAQIVPLSDLEKRQILTRVRLLGITLKDRKVLWVDDHPERNINEREFLRSLGIHFDMAGTNRSAEDLVGKYESLGLPYDLIISDVRRDHEPTDCPECGFSLLRNLCEGEAVCTTPIIFYTDSEASKPTKAFAMTTYTVPFINYVFDALETKATSYSSVQTQIFEEQQ